jgi:hypothetical protein
MNKFQLSAFNYSIGWVFAKQKCFFGAKLFNLKMKNPAQTRLG